MNADTRRGPSAEQSINVLLIGRSVSLGWSIEDQFAGALLAVAFGLGEQCDVESFGQADQPLVKFINDPEDLVDPLPRQTLEDAGFHLG